MGIHLWTKIEKYMPLGKVYSNEERVSKQNKLKKITACLESNRTGRKIRREREC
jgi:hypothetical protein